MLAAVITCFIHIHKYTCKFSLKIHQRTDSQMRTYNKEGELTLPSIIKNQLVTNLINEDAATQKAFYKKYFGYVMSICLRYLNDREDALEICQDIFLKVFQNISKYDVARDFKKWIASIAINACIDKLRKDKNKLKINDIDGDEVSNISFINFDVSDRMDAEYILKLIDRIKPQHKTIFLLYAVDGYSHKEISEMLEINVNTSRWHLAQARKELQPLIKKEYLDESRAGKYY